MNKTLGQILSDAEHVAGFDGVYVSIREEDFDALTLVLDAIHEDNRMLAFLLDSALKVVNSGVALKMEKRMPTTGTEIVLFAELDKFSKIWADQSERFDARNSQIITDQS